MKIKEGGLIGGALKKKKTEKIDLAKNQKQNLTVWVTELQQQWNS